MADVLGQLLEGLTAETNALRDDECPLFTYLPNTPPTTPPSPPPLEANTNARMMKVRDLVYQGSQRGVNGMLFQANSNKRKA